MVLNQGLFVLVYWLLSVFFFRISSIPPSIQPYLFPSNHSLQLALQLSFNSQLTINISWPYLHYFLHLLTDKRQCMTGFALNWTREKIITIMFSTRFYIQFSFLGTEFSNHGNYVACFMTLCFMGYSSLIVNKCVGAAIWTKHLFL